VIPDIHRDPDAGASPGPGTAWPTTARTGLFHSREQWQKEQKRLTEGAMPRVLLLLPLLLMGCAESGRLAYAPSAQLGATAGRPLVAIGEVTDRRQDQGDVIGVIRGGFGNPLKTVHSDQPVPRTVATAFAQALQARRLAAAEAAPYRLDVVVLQLYADKYHRAEAHADFLVTLIDTHNGRPVYRDEAKADVLTGSIVTFDTGIFASGDDLRKLVQQVMNQAIDQTLDKPAFAAALRG
jgi:hypothetical protein